ncbi:hypothetical protein HL653_11695 [Sphingomonas sp. AP4-R1]|uniref:DUF6644 family protein n=1 Tax=Sphingomonas sp. AP4-R1 TaxID=2735134 RepID=UPI0014932DF0|nr:DUF6644 family protein [Sphingomonas sp. AP4-R1]QJU58353.1 hypothetical protein HL653_11695 [Sphingomonas sp. AP4-R1]
MTDFFAWLESTPPAAAIAESAWLFPTLETLHVLGLSFVVGSIAAFDLRILGIAWPARRLETLAHDILPWTWAGFGIAVLTGVLLFSNAATDYVQNPAFLAKMALMALAGLNVLLFHFHPHQRLFAAEGHVSPLLRGSAAISLASWTAIVVLGRWIGFV